MVHMVLRRAFRARYVDETRNHEAWSSPHHLVVDWRSVPRCAKCAIVFRITATIDIQIIIVCVQSASGPLLLSINLIRAPSNPVKRRLYFPCEEVPNPQRFPSSCGHRDAGRRKAVLKQVWPPVSPGWGCDQDNIQICSKRGSHVKEVQMFLQSFSHLWNEFELGTSST